MIFWA